MSIDDVSLQAVVDHIYYTADDVWDEDAQVHWSTRLVEGDSVELVIHNPYDDNGPKRTFTVTVYEN